jgi:hypothetical protein
MKKLTLTLLPLLIAGAIYFTSCKKSNEDLAENNSAITMQLEEPQGRIIVLNQLQSYLDGVLTNNSIISQLIDLENIAYSYVNPDEDSTKIFYFTTESNFKNHIAGSYFESKILNSIHKMDSLQNTGDPNDTTEYLNYLNHKNNNLQTNRRFHSGGQRAHRDGLFQGQTAYYYGWRSSLGSLNQQVSSIQHYGPGVTTWCQKKNYGGKKDVYASLGYIGVDISGSSSNDKYQSVF